MIIANERIDLKSNGTRVTYHNITDQINSLLSKTKLKEGIIVVSSPHTTCSVIFEEFVHDLDWHGDELLQVDLNRILNKLVPRQLTESDYLYPGKKHVEFLEDISKSHTSEFPNDKTTILNADAHIRASLFGSSESFIVKDGKMAIGSVGYIYFIDWDQNRARERNCNILFMGE